MTFGPSLGIPLRLGQPACDTPGVDTLDPRYRYNIVTADGRVLDGGYSAADAAMYVEILRDQGHVVNATVTPTPLPAAA